MTPLLQVRNYAKTFRIHHLERDVHAFAGLNFDLHAGQFMLVSGPNGAGKSTLLRCLYRTYLPSAGSALYQTHHGAVDLATLDDVAMLRVRSEEIGNVTQFLRPRPRISAHALVAEPLSDAGANGTASAQATELLDAFGLKRALHGAYPSTFSGGEQQKVNLARALAVPRRLVLLDEPTASLDAAARAALVARVSTLKAQGVAFIGVFHHPEDIQHLVDDTIKIVPPAGENLLDADRD